MNRLQYLPTAVALAFLGECTPDVDLIFHDGAASPSCMGAAGCPCDDMGAKSCVSGDPLVEVRCSVAINGGPDANGVTEIVPCPELSSCKEGSGCVPCVNECAVAGERSCAVDAATVLLCEVGPANCLVSTKFDCSAAGMSACVVPSLDVVVDEDGDYCVNECGGRNVPLSHKMCEKSDLLPCAFWMCDPTTAELVPDHSACLPSGSVCSANDQCVSCACSNGICVGRAQSCVRGCN